MIEQIKVKCYMLGKYYIIYIIDLSYNLKIICLICFRCFSLAIIPSKSLMQYPVTVVTVLLVRITTH